MAGTVNVNNAFTVKILMGTASKLLDRNKSVKKLMLRLRLCVYVRACVHACARARVCVFNSINVTLNTINHIEADIDSTCGQWRDIQKPATRHYIPHAYFK